uniref:Uncharacterized protein n=1 Tax=Pseudictyota dubia TaxID=2749911 RepID=A0A7R9Z760_9STRA|mmetsp:Transcript_25743/g.47974  ORF Transcript_25743/g.47974 Transcript_25743/m.47974 type:complete len:109 (+) Transcript_25743:3-329(+)
MTGINEQFWKLGWRHFDEIYLARLHNRRRLRLIPGMSHSFPHSVHPLRPVLPSLRSARTGSDDRYDENNETVSESCARNVGSSDRRRTEFYEPKSAATTSLEAPRFLS